MFRLCPFFAIVAISLCALRLHLLSQCYADFLYFDQGGVSLRCKTTTH